MGIVEGKVAIVTGAGRGIGREHALLLAREGAAVMVNDLGGDGRGEGHDLTPAQEVAAEIEAAGGRAAVNGAGPVDGPRFHHRRHRRQRRTRRHGCQWAMGAGWTTRRLRRWARSMDANEERRMPALSSSAATDVNDDPAGYPHDLECDVAGDEGLRYHVRPIRPDDAARLVAFHRQLSPHSVYMRFFTFHPTLTDAEVTRFTTVDYVDRLALVATVGDRLIAVGRFDRAPGANEAEVAFVVADEYQHHGIGSLLLDELARAAWQRGVEVFRADTLAENSAMLEVFRHAGFPVTSGIEYGTVTLRFPIAPTDDFRAALAAREATRQFPPEGSA